MDKRYDSSAVEVEGTRAIEIAAMFEDSVVGVSHLDDPKPAKVGRLATVMFAAGGVALATALGLFLRAVMQVARLRTEWAAWDAQGKPHVEFPLPREGAGIDVVVIVLLAFGVWAVLDGLRRVFRERAPRDYTIGPASHANHSAPESLVPVGAFPLVRATGETWELTYMPNMSGEVTVGAATLQLSDLMARGLAHHSALPGALAYTIPEGARIRVVLGLSTFHISSVAAPRRHHTPLSVDWREQVYTAGCAVAAAAFLALIYAIPPDPKGLALDEFLKDRRNPVFVFKAPDEKEPEFKMPQRIDGRRADGGGRAKGAPGKMGKPESTKRTGLYAIKGPANNRDIRIAKQIAVAEAGRQGVLGVMRDLQGSHVAALWGSESALGNAAENVMGGLIGTQAGEMNGVTGGLGIFGKDKGGGGTRETIGLYDLDTIGHGGKHPGYGGGPVGSLKPDKKKDALIEAVPGPTKVSNGLDKEIVRRVVRKHYNEIKFCYEKELTNKPDLWGRLISDFTIGGNGKVLSSVIRTSTLNSPEVDRCVAQAVARWEFPRPENSGLVLVQYPFSFRPLGQ